MGESSGQRIKRAEPERAIRGDAARLKELLVRACFMDMRSWLMGPAFCRTLSCLRCGAAVRCAEAGAGCCLLGPVPVPWPYCPTRLPLLLPSFLPFLWLFEVQPWQSSIYKTNWMCRSVLRRGAAVRGARGEAHPYLGGISVSVLGFGFCAVNVFSHS